jgi:hypothetical protein
MTIVALRHERDGEWHVRVAESLAGLRSKPAGPNRQIPQGGQENDGQTKLPRGTTVAIIGLPREGSIRGDAQSVKDCRPA